MEMRKDFFYKWHQSSLQKHSTEVDVNAIWAAIEPTVDEINGKRKRRRGFLFFLSFLSISVISVGFLSLFIPTNSPFSARIYNDRNISTSAVKQGIQIDANTIDNNKIAVAIQSTETLPSSSNTNKSTNTVSSRDFLSPTKTVRNDYFKEENSEHLRSLSTSKVPVKLTVGSVDNSSKLSTNEAAERTTQKDKIASSDIVNVSDDVREAWVVYHELPIDIVLVESNKENDKLPAVPINIKSVPDFHFSLGLHSGLAFAEKTLAEKSMLDSEELLILREGTESSLEVWTNGLTGKVTHKSGLSLAIGIQYVKIAERMQYDTDYLFMDSIANQVIGYSNNLLGDRSAIIGYSPENTLYDLKYDFYNNYHLLEMPVSLGYQKQLKGWSIGARASYIHNISLRTKGRILASPFEAINISDKNAQVFKNNIAGSYEFGLSSGYRITSNIELGLEASYRYMPKDITNKFYTISQKYNWLGMNATLNYIF